MTDILDILRIQNDKQGEMRVLKYRDFSSLLKGRHKDVFMNLSSTREIINSPYITVNTVSLISKKQADLMFLKPVQINVDNKTTDKTAKEILNKNNFQQICYKQAITASALGGCFFRIRWGQMNKYLAEKSKTGKPTNNEIIIDAVNPENVFCEIQNGKMISCTIKYVDSKPVVSHKGSITHEEYYIEEHYEPGKYQVSTYLIKQTRNGIELLLLEKPVEKTLPFKTLPVVYIPNILETGFYGVSDFDDKLELIHEINNTLSRISSAVRRYTYPILVATEDWIKKARSKGGSFPTLRGPVEHIKGNGEHVKIKVEDIGVTAAPRDKTGKFQDVFKFIEYNPDLKNIHQHLENTQKLLLKLCSISPALLDNNENLSGKALKLKLTNTLIMIEAKKALWEKGLKDIVKTCVIMHNCFSKKLKVTDKLLENLNNIYINWGNALSILETDKTDQIIKKVEAGLMSRKRALMILENMNGQDAETEIDLIDQDA